MTMHRPNRKMAFTSRFQKELSKFDLISKSDRILVAFSGGKDSVCLLFLLHELQRTLEIDVAACHVHHGIRGKEADDDLSFSKAFCKERRIPFYFKYVDAPSYAKENKLGLEESARILRYKALEETAEQNGYNKIATAHTASDQSETVLFRLIRGGGFDGLQGIPPKRDRIIRPLLPFFKEEILDFLQEKHIDFTEDSTNGDTIYSRNRLRGIILPEMKQINPSVEQSLVRFSKIVEEQHELISALCNDWEEKRNVTPASGRIPLTALSELSKNPALLPLLKEVLFRMVEKEKIVIDFLHYKALTELLKHPTEGKIIEIGKGFVFQIDSDTLVFRKNETEKKRIDYQVKLDIGEVALPFPETKLKLSMERSEKIENINKKLLIIHAAFDKIEGNLVARNRKEGDVIRIGNMTKSVKKLFQEEKIPLRYRDSIPLICDDKGIIWIPYVGLCDRVRKSDGNEVITMELISSYFPKNI